MNKILNGLKETANYGLTENGGVKHISTLNNCLDMFAMGASYRNRNERDCLLLFKKALEEDSETAMKLLFYIADIRGGQGERRFFRVCYQWLAINHTEIARRNLEFIPEYRRWDDLYCLINTPLQKDALDFMKKQFILDLNCKTPSLLGKWLKSENASSQETKILAAITRKHFGLTPKQYRRGLSELRTRINIVEKLMSSNQWDKIEFDKLPSKAGLKYKNAFARRDIIAKKYEAFATNKETKVNAGTLYPYEIVEKALEHRYKYGFIRTEVDRAMINKYWENLPDFFRGRELNGIAVVDTSGSMQGDPINVAISLGLYMAERAKGPFANHYISFSSRPQLIETCGIDFCDKVERIYKTNLIDNTNIEAVFDLILNTAIKTKASQEDLPQNIFVISDMEFDSAVSSRNLRTDSGLNTVFDTINKKFLDNGYKMPHLIFWNVDARSNNIPMINPNNKISYVSGFSPVIFETVMSMSTGFDLMKEVVNKERYSPIH